MDAYVVIEGFPLSSGYIVKELTILYPNNEYTHLLFQKPNIWLSHMDVKTVRYVTRHIHGLSFDDGDVPLTEFANIISKLKEFTVYTYSLDSLHVLQGILPTTVIISIKEKGYSLPMYLPDPDCCRSHENYRNCSKAKALAIKEIVENNSY